jgi:glycosyltransferase involved in cell wall biosynthesis
MKLSIIIPTKNEEKTIVNLLSSLQKQEFDWTQGEIILSDAHSTDSTTELAKVFIQHHSLPFQVVEGGLPAIGRNNGAKVAKNEILLFLDADIILKDTDILTRVLELFQNPKVELSTALINCTEDMRANVLYNFSNLFQYMSKLTKPYASTMFLATRADTFRDLGGFDEKAKHMEDVLFTQQIERKAYRIIDRTILAGNRRFKQMGYVGFVLYFLKNSMNIHNKEYFYKDIGYWDHS